MTHPPTISMGTTRSSTASWELQYYLPPALRSANASAGCEYLSFVCPGRVTCKVPLNVLSTRD